MNTAGIYVKTQPEVKAKAQKIARDLGLSLSALVNIWLIRFVKTGRVDFSLEVYASSVKRDSSARFARSE
jgi:antitoxin component of RelBE/YafQ-DinJ toxin-antitoxin module